MGTRAAVCCAFSKTTPRSSEALTKTQQPTLPSPSIIVVHGAPATGKSGLLEAYLTTRKLTFAIVRCRECVTGRHLLERTTAAVRHALQASAPSGPSTSHDGRCESLSALAVNLERLLAKQGKFILLFDELDKQREGAPTLLPALARLGENVWSGGCSDFT